MTQHDRDDEALDALFGQARAQEAEPSGALMARVLADAQATQPRAPAPPVPARAAPGGGLRGLWAALGGWPALGGLTAATVAGVWLGVSPPAALGDWAATTFGLTETVALATGGDLFGLAEG